MTVATIQPASTLRVISASTAVKEAIDLLVVIVNFRTPALTVQCLASLEAEMADVPAMRVVVADNASADGSAEKIRAAVCDRGWQAWARVVETPRNGGFAYGNNRAIEEGLAGFEPRYVLLLNSDTIVHAGCMRASIAAMDADPGIGAASACLLNADGTVQNVARRFPTPLRLAVATFGLPWKSRLFAWADCEDSGWDRQNVSRDVDWLGGAFLLVRAEVLKRIGGLDERFFFYGEDIEFCHRVTRAGHRCRYIAGPRTTHLGGQSSDPTRMPSRSKLAAMWGARYRVQRLCYGAWAAWFVWSCDVVAIGARTAWTWVSLGGRSQRFGDYRGLLNVLLKEARP
jgi:N-acetylglucosaminyl-diphospho-decaprenol L-rhamnosyltransferase